MDFSNVSLQSLSVHYVGNKQNEQHLTLSKKPLEADETLSLKLRDYFLSRFPNVYEKYRFTHTDSLQFNEVYTYCKELFNGETPLHLVSVKIAQHLYEASVHPKVKPGELYVCYFTDCYAEGKTIDAIGIFKTETKSGFLEVDRATNGFSIVYKEGIDINKFDKGCLILNSKEKEGYEVNIIDNQNRGEEALYWKETFLGLGLVKNDFSQTNQFLGIAKNFVTEQLPEEFEISKPDRIDLLNRSVEYFKTHETFEKEEFEQEVFQSKQLIDSFRNYDKEFRENNDWELIESFEISPQAVKKQARIFKSVLKLDKNFHIYIHGDKNMIEQGVEKDGRKYYKIYYKEES